MVPCPRAPRGRADFAACLGCAACAAAAEELVEPAPLAAPEAPAVDPRDMVAGESPAPAAPTVSAPPHETSPVAGASPTFTLADLEAGAVRLAVVTEARALRAAGLGWEEIGRKLDLPFISVYKWVRRVEHISDPTVEDLTTVRTVRSLARHGATPEDVAALRANYLLTNRTADTGSAEEAARMALRKAELTPALAELLRSRDAAGLPLLPDSLRKKVIVHRTTVRAFRNPTEANLDYISCPGSLKFVTDKITGQERFAVAGDLLEMDDATINFCVCVPWERGGVLKQKCADKFGVLVGRFQWLVTVDVGELFVPGYSYTARPRGSYRGEDVLATLLGVFRQHGVWERARFERGVFESNLVTSALERLRVQLITVHSPHSKAFIEGLFNSMWTKLSDMPGQVGRFRGEMEEEGKLLQACRAGHKDPRKFFPMLNDALLAFDRAILERNAQWVRSANYGQWVPEQRWLEHKDAGHLRPLDPQAQWIFSPCIREATVKGVGVGCSVAMMEGLSIRYDFMADWLLQHDGDRVKLFFDPFVPDCVATIVADGEVIGQAPQVNKMAQYARRMFGYADDVDAGQAEARAAAQSLRRNVVAVLPGGKPGVRLVEARDSAGNVLRAEADPAPAVARPRGGLVRPATPAEFAKQRERLSRLAAAQAALMEQ